MNCSCMMILNLGKLLLSLNGKTDQKATKTALAVRIFDAKTFLQEVYARQARLLLYACRLAPKLLTSLIQTPDTFENRNVISYNLKIFTRIHVFSAQNWQKNYNIQPRP